MEIQMGKSKYVGDSAMVTDLGDDMLVIGKPDVEPDMRRRADL